MHQIQKACSKFTICQKQNEANLNSSNNKIDNQQFPSYNTLNQVNASNQQIILNDRFNSQKEIIYSINNYTDRKSKKVNCSIKIHIDNSIQDQKMNINKKDNQSIDQHKKVKNTIVSTILKQQSNELIQQKEQQLQQCKENGKLQKSKQRRYSASNLSRPKYLSISNAVQLTSNKSNKIQILNNETYDSLHFNQQSLYNQNTENYFINSKQNLNIADKLYLQTQNKSVEDQQIFEQFQDLNPQYLSQQNQITQNFATINNKYFSQNLSSPQNKTLNNLFNQKIQQITQSSNQQYQIQQLSNNEQQNVNDQATNLFRFQIENNQNVNNSTNIKNQNQVQTNPSKKRKQVKENKVTQQPEFQQQYQQSQLQQSIQNSSENNDDPKQSHNHTQILQKYSNRLGISISTVPNLQKLNNLINNNEKYKNVNNTQQLLSKQQLYSLPASSKGDQSFNLFSPQYQELSKKLEIQNNKEDKILIQYPIKSSRNKSSSSISQKKIYNNNINKNNSKTHIENTSESINCDMVQKQNSEIKQRSKHLKSNIKSFFQQNSQNYYLVNPSQSSKNSINKNLNVPTPQQNSSKIQNQNNYHTTQKSFSNDQELFLINSERIQCISSTKNVGKTFDFEQSKIENCGFQSERYNYINSQKFIQNLDQHKNSNEYVNSNHYNMETQLFDIKNNQNPLQCEKALSECKSRILNTIEKQKKIKEKQLRMKQFYCSQEDQTTNSIHIQQIFSKENIQNQERNSQDQINLSQINKNQINICLAQLQTFKQNEQLYSGILIKQSSQNIDNAKKSQCNLYPTPQSELMLNESGQANNLLFPQSGSSINKNQQNFETICSTLISPTLNNNIENLSKINSLNLKSNNKLTKSKLITESSSASQLAIKQLNTNSNYANKNYQNLLSTARKSEVTHASNFSSDSPLICNENVLGYLTNRYEDNSKFKRYLSLKTNSSNKKVNIHQTNIINSQNTQPCLPILSKAFSDINIQQNSTILSNQHSCSQQQVYKLIQPKNEILNKLGSICQFATEGQQLAQIPLNHLVYQDHNFQINNQFKNKQIHHKQIDFEHNKQQQERLQNGFQQQNMLQTFMDDSILTIVNTPRDLQDHLDIMKDNEVLEKETIQQQLQNFCQETIVSEDISFRIKDMINQQQNYNPNPDYLDIQTDITWMMRCLLFDWMFEVCQDLTLKRDTLYLSLNYVDRFLSLQNISKHNLQLIGIVSLFIASKVEEVVPHQIQQFARCSNDGYTVAQIMEYELLILKELDWKIHPSTSITWLNIYTVVWDSFVQTSFEKPNKFQVNFVQDQKLTDKNYMVYYRIPNLNSYTLFLQITQILDIMQLDINILRFESRMVIASLMYLQLGIYYKQFTQIQIQNGFSEKYLFLNYLNNFNEYFNSFLTMHFNFNLIDILSTLQYTSIFFNFEYDYSVAPSINMKDPQSIETSYEEYLSYQTYYPKGIEYMRQKYC